MLRSKCCAASGTLACYRRRVCYIYGCPCMLQIYTRPSVVTGEFLKRLRLNGDAYNPPGTTSSPWRLTGCENLLTRDSLPTSSDMRFAWGANSLPSRNFDACCLLTYGWRYDGRSRHLGTTGARIYISRGRCSNTRHPFHENACLPSPHDLNCLVRFLSVSQL
jgi:hypothetical protein